MTQSAGDGRNDGEASGNGIKARVDNALRELAFSGLFQPITFLIFLFLLEQASGDLAICDQSWSQGECLIGFSKSGRNSKAK